MKNKKDLLYITDALQYPYDEGFRKFSYYFYKSLLRCSDSIILNKNEHLEKNDNVEFYEVNNLFLDYKFLKKIKEYKKVIYLPLASLTFNSIIRALIISKIAKCQIYLVGLQERTYTRVQERVIKRIKSITYILLNGFSSTELFSNIINVESGVDSSKYNVIENKDKLIKIKNNYLLPIDKKILLHVGHIKNGRNVDDLITIQERIPSSQVVLVNSSSTECDPTQKKRLLDEGIIVIDRYIDNISELYNISDVYLFLVKDSNNFICQPLSVLEALACGNQVIAYDFVLRNRFERICEGIIYFNDVEDIISFLSNYISPTNEQRKNISNSAHKNYNWELVINNVVRKVMNPKYD